MKVSVFGNGRRVIPPTRTVRTSRVPTASELLRSTMPVFERNETEQYDPTIGEPLIYEPNAHERFLNNLNERSWQSCPAEWVTLPNEITPFSDGSVFPTFNLEGWVPPKLTYGVNDSTDVIKAVESRYEYLHELIDGEESEVFVRDRMDIMSDVQTIITTVSRKRAEYPNSPVYLTKDLMFFGPDLVLEGDMIEILGERCLPERDAFVFTDYTPHSFLDHVRSCFGIHHSDNYSTQNTQSATIELNKIKESLASRGLINSSTLEDFEEEFWNDSTEIVNRLLANEEFQSSESTNFLNPFDLSSDDIRF